MAKDHSTQEPRTVELSRMISIGQAVPSEPQIEWLRRHGYRSVMDLRQDGEPTRDPMPAAEAAAVRRHGMDYIRAPAPTDRVEWALLDEFGAALADAAKPVFVHCASGKRAGMYALAHVCVQSGVPGEEMLVMARHLDVLYGPENLRRRFAHYVDDRQARQNPLERRESMLHERGHPNPVLPANIARTTGSADIPPSATAAAMAPSPPVDAVRNAPRRRIPTPDWRLALQVSAVSLAAVAIVLARRRIAPVLLVTAALMVGLSLRTIPVVRRRNLILVAGKDAKEEAEVAALEARLRRLERSI